MGQKDSSQFNSEFCQLAQNTISRFNNNIFEYISYIFPWLGQNILGPFVAATGKLRGDPFHVLIEKIYEAVRQRKAEKMEKDGKEKEEDGRWVDFIDLFLESEAEKDEIELNKNTGIYNKTEKVGEGDFISYCYLWEFYECEIITEN